MSKNYFLVVPLILLMALTRSHHVGNAVALPDASLAVFFLAGFFFASRSLFLMLLVQAAMIDYVEISQLNVSDFCISSAYIFLIPTYLTMWLGGRLSAKIHAIQGNKIGFYILSIGILAVATTGAFLLSSGSFYLFSGHFEALSLSAFIDNSTVYFPPYAHSAITYALLGFAIQYVIKRLPLLISKKVT
ncbi:MAG: hypothetical protein QG557_110 [Pseudomonadota bacterium]|nr:hypothetical protein [Pseudomonadota bacterium]